MNGIASVLNQVPTAKILSVLLCLCAAAGIYIYQQHLAESAGTKERVEALERAKIEQNGALREIGNVVGEIRTEQRAMAIEQRSMRIDVEIMKRKMEENP